jgi:YD repeat-containing protein
VQPPKNRIFTVRWQYASNGRLQSMTYPDGTTLSYGY